jgi:hypothetical protein
LIRRQGASSRWPAFSFFRKVDIAMRYKRIAFRVCEALFLAEAGLLFLVQWQQALSWLNPLLFGIGFHSMSHSRRVYGRGAITAAILLLGYRLTRY